MEDASYFSSYNWPWPIKLGLREVYGGKRSSLSSLPPFQFSQLLATILDWKPKTVGKPQISLE